MKLHIYCIIVVLVATVSCNNEIFINRSFEMPASQEIDIVGDGGSDVLDYQPDGLKQIVINLFDSKEIFTYYDKKGNIIDEDSPADIISSIRYNDPFCEFSIDFSGNRIWLNCAQNCTGETVTVPLLFVYEYGVRNLKINVMPGKSMYLLSWNYDDDCVGKEKQVPYLTSTTYNNNSEGPLIVYVEPYRNVQCRARIMPQEEWADGKNVDVPVPSFMLKTDDEAEWGLVDIGQIRLGTYMYYDIPFNGDRIPVTVPAHTSVRVTVSVDFVKALFTGSLRFMSPVYNGIHDTTFKCELYEPSDYKIDIQEL